MIWAITLYRFVTVNKHQQLTRHVQSNLFKCSILNIFKSFTRINTNCDQSYISNNKLTVIV